MPNYEPEILGGTPRDATWGAHPVWTSPRAATREQRWRIPREVALELIGLLITIGAIELMDGIGYVRRYAWESEQRIAGGSISKSIDQSNQVRI